MNRVFIILCIALLVACHSGKHESVVDAASKTKAITNPNKPTPLTAKEEKSIDEELDEQTLPFYLVIADTGLNYNLLRQKMTIINKDLKIKIDTLGRFYNRKKNLIQLPDNDPDEIYAGDYFLRRGEGESLSLEYLNAYKGSSNEKMMALLSGIYEKKSSADSALSLLRKTSANSFVLKADIYMGCMH